MIAKTLLFRSFCERNIHLTIKSYFCAILLLNYWYTFFKKDEWNDVKKKFLSFFPTNYSPSCVTYLVYSRKLNLNVLEIEADVSKTIFTLLLLIFLLFFHVIFVVRSTPFWTKLVSLPFMGKRSIQPYEVIDS